LFFLPEESALPFYLSRSKMCHIIFRNIIQNAVEIRKSEVTKKSPTRTPYSHFVKNDWHSHAGFAMLPVINLIE